MCIGVLIVDCLVTESLSLKSKRHVLTSLIDRIRRSFNVAAAEIEFQDQWQRSRLAFVLINTNCRMMQSTLAKLEEFLYRERRISILGVETRQLV